MLTGHQHFASGAPSPLDSQPPRGTFTPPSTAEYIGQLWLIGTDRCLEDMGGAQGRKGHRPPLFRGQHEELPVLARHPFSIGDKTGFHAVAYRKGSVPGQSPSPPMISAP